MRSSVIFTRILAIIFAIFIICQYGYSNNIIQQQYQFKYLGIDEGLSHGRVQTIVQDQFGYVWLGTRQGINRFDGYTNKVFSQFLFNDTLYDIPVVNEMVVDYNDKLWAATSVGLLYFDVNTETFIKYSVENININKGSNAISLKVGADNSLWLTTSNNLFNLNTNSNEGREYGLITKEGDLISNITECFIQSNGNIWIGFASNGCGVLDLQTEIFTHYINDPLDPNSFGDRRVHCFYEDESGNVWAGLNDNGISIFDPKSGMFSNYLPDSLNPTSGRIRSIIKDPQGILWLGTMAGLYQVDPINWVFKRYAYSDHLYSTLSHNSVQCIYIDNQQTMWVGTYAGGVSYTNLARNGFFHYRNSIIPNKYFLSQKDINCLATDSKGLLWIGTESGGLNLFNESTGEYIVYKEDNGNPDALQSNNIKSLEITPEDNLWVGTYNGGLSYFDVTTQKFKTYNRNSTDIPGLGDNRIYSIVLDKNENLWVSTARTLQLLLKDSTSFISFSEETTGYEGAKVFAQVNSIIEDSRGWVWFTGQSSIYLYKPNEKIFFDLSELDDFDRQVHYNVTEDEMGNIWFDNGLGQIVRYDAEKDLYKIFGKDDNIPQVVFSGFVSDQLGNLWATSLEGLYKFINLINSQDSINYLDYGKDDGLQSKFFYPGSIFRSTSNEIYVGGVNGFNSFKPEDVKLNPFSPGVVFTNLKINNRYVKVGEKVGKKVILKKSLLASEKLLFHSKVKVFSIEFAGLHFVSPNQNKYKYILEGYDDDWISATADKRVATYSNLPAGKYVFKVMASNNDEVWNETPIELSIKVRPPFYKTKWFIILLIIGVIVGVYYGIKAREQQLKADKEILEESLNNGKAQLEKQQEEIKQQQEEIKIRDEQEKEIRWYNSGLAKFSEVFSKNKENEKALSQAIIINLIEYIEADQGAVFLLNDNDPENPQLDFAAGYAYSSDDESSKVFYPGEGYIGTCYYDKEIVELDDVPENYLKIESGLGALSPKYIVFIPMKFDELVNGVIEIASFNKIEKYKIEFIEKVLESATSILTIIKSEQQSKLAVEEAKQNSEELQSADEELRQNLEEMAAIQEELSRNQVELLTEQAMFQTLMDFLEDRITFKDPESTYLRINKIKAKALKLKDSTTAIGKSDKHFFGEEHFKKAYKSEKEIFNKGLPIINQEESLKFKDGSIKWGSTSRVPFKSEDGKSAGTLIITKDITNFKSLENDNNANKELLETVAQECPILLFNLDNKFKISNVSGNGLTISGLKKSMLNDKNFFKVFDIPEEQVEKNQENITFKTEFKVENKNLTFEHKFVYNNSTEGYNCCSVISLKSYT